MVIENEKNRELFSLSPVERYSLLFFIREGIALKLDDSGVETNALSGVARERKTRAKKNCVRPKGALSSNVLLRTLSFSTLQELAY